MDFLVAEPGVTALVDGQYGSTGKGVIAAYIANFYGRHFNLVTSNAGPNSGHTSHFGDEEVVLKQLPTLAVQTLKRWGYMPTIYLNGGAVVNHALLTGEVYTHLGVARRGQVVVHPCAAEITEALRLQDGENVKNVASTGQGVGPAIIAKLGRRPEAVIGNPVNDKRNAAYILGTLTHALNDTTQRVFMEVSQGFSLGINQSRFYPNTTTRECTVGQALADAGISPRRLHKVIMSLRTFPIRVGNTENTSGGCYSDQVELDWKQIGQQPEYTTVTKRQRRVFSFSRNQFIDALTVNTPDVLFINFMNYLKPEDRTEWMVANILEPYVRVMGRFPDAVLAGMGPFISDVKNVNLQTGAIQK